MTETDQVTVAIIARNEAQSVAAAVRSVVDNFAGPIIVVDDFSSDETAQIAVSVAPEQVTIVRPDHHVGIGMARQTALTAVATPYFCWLDADDMFLSGHIYRLLSLARKTAADLVFEGVELVDLNNEGASQSIPPPDFLFDENGAYRLFERNWIEGSAFPMLRTAFARSIGYDSTIEIGEDYNFIQRALLARGKIRFRKDIGYRYVHKADSLSRNLARSEEGFRQNLALIPDRIVRRILAEEGFDDRQAAWILVGRAAARKNHDLVLNYLNDMNLLAGNDVICSDPSGPYPFPDHYRAEFHAGVAYLAKKENDAAIASFQAATEIWQSADGFNNLGIAYARSGEIRKATACFEMACRLFPDYLDAQQNLAAAEPNRVTNLPLRALPSRSRYSA